LCGKQVDERLNGDGTGKILGISDSILGWVILGVFTLVWTQYFAAQKDVDGGVDTDDDSGLTL
jgi:photosystem II PsbW protein